MRNTGVDPSVPARKPDDSLEFRYYSPEIHERHSCLA